jgi:drug/metabolite transporter (DMT)-like permease
VTGAELAGGMALAGGAALCFEGGYALQAYEARRAPSESSLRPSLLLYLVRRPLWLAAGALLVLGWPLQVAALRVAPLTLVQPTLALGLLLLLAFAARFLHEPVGAPQILGVVAIAAGTGVIAWAAPEHSESHGDAARLAVALAPLAAVTLAPYAMMAAGWIRRRATRPGRRTPAPGGLPSTPLAGWALMVSTGAADAWAAIAAKLIADEIGRGNWGAALAWAVSAGAMFGLGLLSEMTALQRMRASQVGPTVLAMQIGLPVALAPVALGESWSGTPLGGAAIGLGLAVVVAGVAVLSGSGPVERLAEAERRPAPAG